MLMLGNMERKFKHWKDLYDACEGSLEIINNEKITQFIDFILSSSGLLLFLFKVFLKSDSTINHNSIKIKEKTMESKVSAEEVLFLANRNAREKYFKVDRSEEIAKKLVEQCFYNLENKQLPLMINQIILLNLDPTLFLVLLLTIIVSSELQISHFNVKFLLKCNCIWQSFQGTLSPSMG
ncbi:hypothetical protein RFI_29554 [Reticulomyxa filosa]|uniref:Uncharacterized protein n=1 Tax=Reticulomyxa filosa TaxID=46433 RepID=X6M2M2_RETFI|nr:hypothetical protein RFI_29554 [Reticulomyxa filosa]|eukprot:ETO07836.1 hypothetical protein RFI_29554 [Reticulomyxa filosa]